MPLTKQILNDTSEKIIKVLNEIAREYDNEHGLPISSGYEVEQMKIQVSLLIKEAVKLSNNEFNPDLPVFSIKKGLPRKNKLLRKKK